jgi:ubiquinone/menaquinone biosynthesis C-methylase UbiE
MTEDTKSTVRREFGANAGAYVTSATHAKGASLERLLALTKPQPEWHVLDIATGAGHTALAFAPHVRQVWATDITPEMLEQVSRQTSERNVGNIVIELADAEQLPYADSAFDLVTCRIAPHHFDAPELFVSDAARVLKPGGLLAVVDNIVPRGVAGDYINAFEKLRDPSHVRCLSLEEWHDLFAEHGFAIEHAETLYKRISFATWAARHDTNMQRYLLALLRESSGETADFLQPYLDEEPATFRLWEGIIVGRQASAAP